MVRLVLHLWFNILVISSFLSESLQYNVFILRIRAPVTVRVLYSYS